MKLECLDAQIVVTADAHNPTVLNPDFLSSNIIVPKEWAWTAKEPIITTPAFSQVTYGNGVYITVEPLRLRVVDPAFNGEPATSKIADIAGKYASVLQHVKYTAVGTNFRMFIPMGDPDEYLKAKFVKEGPWYGSQHTPIAAGLKLTYGLQTNGRLLLEFSSVTLKRNLVKTETGIIIGSNFHRECGVSPARDVSEHVRHFADDWTRNLDFVREVLALDGV